VIMFPAGPSQSEFDICQSRVPLQGCLWMVPSFLSRFKDGLSSAGQCLQISSAKIPAEYLVDVIPQEGFPSGVCHEDVVSQQSGL
jgi:hypothetical protein